MTIEFHRANNATIQSQTDRQTIRRSRLTTNRASGTRTYNNSFKPVDDYIPGPDLRRLRVGLHVERESFWLATSGHHLVHRRHRRFLRCYCPSRRIRSEGEIVREGHAACGISDGGLNMQITEITIRPTINGVVGICGHCF
jgi:hypothetical protein